MCYTIKTSSKESLCYIGINCEIAIGTMIYSRAYFYKLFFGDKER